MSRLIVFLALICLVSAKSMTKSRAQFEDFVTNYRKTYSSPLEKEQRFRIFQSNLDRASQLNAKSRTATFGVNKFADLTADEFKHFYLIENFESFRHHNKENAAQITLPQSMDIPTSFDWRSRGAVTPVKNQEQCGSCWAFSATEAIESAWFLAGNTLTSLAPQQIVDCDLGNGDEGCNGGDTTTAYQYVMKAGGMEREIDYPYVGEDEPCRFNKEEVAATISNWAYITQNKNETEMQIGLYSQGPLSICVDAASWQLYVFGVITSPEICGDSLDHCVMITGYQTYKDSIWGSYPVWNIRNSWGADWGESGYIFVERGYDLCGVADEVTVPLIH